MALVDETYSKLLKQILDYGYTVDGRNGKVLTCSGLTAEFSHKPLISLRKTAWKLALREMEWFLSGSTNINYLHESVRHWWSPWADKHGNIKNSYGAQFRKPSADGQYTQFESFMLNLKNDPYSRRHVITTWNSSDMTTAPIANCHGTVIQAHVFPTQLHGYTSETEINFTLMMYQRSADMILGVPHNWIQYWALGMYLEYHTGHKFSGLKWFGGDCHIYDQHVKLANKIIKYPIDSMTSYVNFNYVPTVPNFSADDFKISGTYEPIFLDKAEMIV